jgi:hypothetical protein
MLNVQPIRMVRMVEVFKTNVDNAVVAEQIRETIRKQFPRCKVNFDLEDCDKILRVEPTISTESIISIVQNHNYFCEPLE